MMAMMMYTIVGGIFNDFGVLVITANCLFSLSFSPRKNVEKEKKVSQKYFLTQTRHSIRLNRSTNLPNIATSIRRHFCFSREKTPKLLTQALANGHEHAY